MRRQFAAGTPPTQDFGSTRVLHHFPRPTALKAGFKGRLRKLVPGDQSTPHGAIRAAARKGTRDGLGISGPLQVFSGRFGTRGTRRPDNVLPRFQWVLGALDSRSVPASGRVQIPSGTLTFPGILGIRPVTFAKGPVFCALPRPCESRPFYPTQGAGSSRTGRSDPECPLPRPRTKRLTSPRFGRRGNAPQAMGVTCPWPRTRESRRMGCSPSSNQRKCWCPV